MYTLNFIITGMNNMDILIFKTNIDSEADFLEIRKDLLSSYNIKECTVDFEDKDRVMRIAGNNLKLSDIAASVNTMGFLCEELTD